LIEAHLNICQIVDNISLFSQFLLGSESCEMVNQTEIVSALLQGKRAEETLRVGPSGFGFALNVLAEGSSCLLS
jgi:hypothetical protein